MDDGRVTSTVGKGKGRLEIDAKAVSLAQKTHALSLPDGDPWTSGASACRLVAGRSFAVVLCKGQDVSIHPNARSPVASLTVVGSSLLVHDTYATPRMR